MSCQFENDTVNVFTGIIVDKLRLKSRLKPDRYDAIGVVEHSKLSKEYDEYKEKQKQEIERKKKEAEAKAAEDF